MHLTIDHLRLNALEWKIVKHQYEKEQQTECTMCMYMPHTGIRFCNAIPCAVYSVHTLMMHTQNFQF